MGVEIGMQTQTLTIVPPDETGIIGKIAQLKVCLLNSINSLNVILNVKEKIHLSVALPENVNHLVHSVDNDLSSIGALNTDDSEVIDSMLPRGVTKVSLQPLYERSAEHDVAVMTAKMDATFETSGVISQKAVCMQYINNFCRCLY